MRSAELLKALSNLCERIPFQGSLGFKLLSIEPTILRFDMRKDLIGHPTYGRLHGGVISTALDSVGGLAIMVAIAEKHPDESVQTIMVQRFSRLGTIDLRTDFLRPVNEGRKLVLAVEPRFVRGWDRILLPLLKSRDWEEESDRA